MSIACWPVLDPLMLQCRAGGDHASRVYDTSCAQSLLGHSGQTGREVIFVFSAEFNFKPGRNLAVGPGSCMLMRHGIPPA
jgi:hypothetical protein